MGHLLRNWFEEGRWLDLKDLSANPDLLTPEGRTEYCARTFLQEILNKGIPTKLFRVKYTSPFVPIEYQLWRDTQSENRLVGSIRFHKDLGIIFDEMTFNGEEKKVLRQTHSKLENRSVRYQTVDEFMSKDSI